MPLKLTVADFSEVSESLRSVYRPRHDGDGYILDVEGGVVPKATHDEFRQNNIALRKQLQDLGDPTEIAGIREKVRALEQDLEKARRGASADAEARIAAVTKSRDALQQQLEAVLIDQQVTRIAAQVGAVPGAVDDIARRIRPQFKLTEDGQPVATDRDGNKIYGEDGQPLTVEGAVRSLTRVAPHLFRASSGGGAAHSSAGGGRISSGSNPWRKETWNVTEQMRAIKADKAEAARMAAEHGHQLT